MISLLDTIGEVNLNPIDIVKLYDNPYLVRPSTSGEDNAVRKFKRELKKRIENDN